MQMAGPVETKTILQCFGGPSDNGSIEEKQRLYHEWRSKITENKFYFECRTRNEEWFQRCYEYCEGERRSHEAKDFNQMVMIDRILYDNLIQKLNHQIEQEKEIVVKLDLQNQLNDLQAHLDPETWIQRAHNCFAEEKNLVEKYSQVIKEVFPAEESYEQLYTKLVKTHESVRNQLNLLEEDVRHYKQEKENLDRHVENIQQMRSMQNRMSQNGVVNGKNGTSCNSDIENQALTVLSNRQENIQQIRQKFQEDTEKLQPDFDAMFKDSQALVGKIVEDLKKWQHQLKLKHAELYAEEDAQKFASWCAKTGELLRNITVTDFLRLQDACRIIPDSEQILSQYRAILQKFTSLQTFLYQRTFVVSHQDTWNVKKNILRPISVNLRMSEANARVCRYCGKLYKSVSGLHSHEASHRGTAPRVCCGKPYYSNANFLRHRMFAADSSAGIGGVKVHAFFVTENDINSCHDPETGKLHLNKLMEKSLKFKRGQSAKFIQNQSTTEAHFNIELHVNIKRAKTLQVFEEKYRLIFYTQLGNQTYWTLSMPMVITTGASQQCQCLASVMWQCFSTNVFTVPIEPVRDLPWKTVSEMLQAKMKNLSSQRSLSEENIQHLKERLLGKADASDDTSISLHHFCSKHVRQSEEPPPNDFTFWEWFLSIYNLVALPEINKFWKNGWIEGFLSKETAAKKLRECKTYRSGIFLLRFSDRFIRPSQGKDAVYGSIATAVSTLCEGVKEVEHFIIMYDDLKQLPLANILLGTKNNKTKTPTKMYEYLYPHTNKPCTELLKDYTVPAPLVPGYTSVEKAFLANLDKLVQDVHKMEIGVKRGISRSRTSNTAVGAVPKKMKPSHSSISPCTSDNVYFNVQDTIQPSLLPTVIMDPVVINPNCSSENRTFKKTVLNKAVNTTNSKTQTGKNSGPTEMISGSNQKDKDHIYEQILLEPNKTVGNQLQSIPFIDCLNSTVRQEDVTDSGSNEPQLQEQEYKYMVPSSQEMTNSINKIAKEAENLTGQTLSEENKTLEMIRNHLEYMSPETIMKAIPVDKIIELMTPSLDKLPSQMKTQVLQDLSDRMVGCQSNDTVSADDDLNEFDLLQSDEIETGLSLNDEDVYGNLTDLELGSDLEL